MKMIVYLRVFKLSTVTLMVVTMKNANSLNIPVMIFMFLVIKKRNNEYSDNATCIDIFDRLSNCFLNISLNI